MITPVLINDPKFKFVVVGGGTAGWLTALYMRQYYPLASITLIESPEIGILGAGEGTTPHFIRALDELNIPVTDIIKHAKGTFKNGIKFTGWNTGKNSDFYYHSFANTKDLDYTANTSVNWCTTPLAIFEQLSKKETLNEIDFSALVSERNAVKFIHSSELHNKNYNSLYHFKNLGDFSLHFDANLLASYLKKVGAARNIDILQATVKKVITDKREFITGLKLQGGMNVDCNFVFDCTGFSRMLIGNYFKSEWKSYKEHLPVNRALPFFIPIEDNAPIPPYTEAIAMKYGWSWKIPVQGRFGCGYVFDSNQISDEQAKEEIDRLTGIDTEIPRSFSFEAGTYKKQWIKNCVAIGLSSGFIEPLEATSIWMSIVSIRSVLTYMKGITERSEAHIEAFNTETNNAVNDVLTFVYFHYLTNKVDTPFWRDFAKNNKQPDFIQALIKQNKDVVHVTADARFAPQAFTPHSWLQVGTGTRFFNQEEASKSFAALNQGINRDAYNFAMFKVTKNLNHVKDVTIDHRKFLQYLIEN